MSYSRVIIGDRFGNLLDEITPDIDQFNWRLNNIGKLKFKIDRTDSKATQANLRFGNRIIIRSDNGLPDWGGIIDTPRNWRKGTIGVSAYSGVYLLKYRITDKGRYFSGETVGGILDKIINEANDIEPTGVLIGSVWTGGTLHGPEYHFKDLLDITQKSLTKRLSTAEFDIKPVIVNDKITFEITLYETMGFDRTGLGLHQGKNLAEIALKEQGPIINSWSVAGEGTGWGNERITHTSQNTESIGLYGLREDSKVYGDVKLPSTLENNADNLLADSAWPYNIYTLRVVDKLPARFEDYDLGDTISLIAHDFGFEGIDTTVRILGRSFDPNSGLCDLVVRE